MSVLRDARHSDRYCEEVAGRHYDLATLTVNHNLEIEHENDT